MSTSSPTVVRANSGGVKDKWHATKGTVQTKVGQVKRHLHEGSETVQEGADAAVQQAKSLTNQARAHVPAPAAGRLNRLTRVARQRPVPAAAMALVVLVFLLLGGLHRRAKRGPW